MGRPRKDGTVASPPAPELDAEGNPVVKTRKPRTVKPVAPTFSPNVERLHSRARIRLSRVVAIVAEYNRDMAENLVEQLTLLLATTSAETFSEVCEFVENILPEEEEEPKTEENTETE